MYTIFSLSAIRSPQPQPQPHRYIIAFCGRRVKIIIRQTVSSRSHRVEPYEIILLLYYCNRRLNINGRII